MNPELIQKLATAAEGMPAFPQSVQKILRLTRDINCSHKDLIQIIDKDPVVAVKVLGIVNSAYYALTKPITSINHAVVYLGLNTIKNLTLKIAAIGMLPTHNAAGFDGPQYLLHSLATAGIAKQLAPRVVDANPMDCFIAGLLHDYGKVVLARFMPAEFRIALELSQEKKISLHLTLREVIGIDHTVVGAMLLEKWRFAPNLVETIRHQYGTDLKDTDMIACVFAANQISKKLEFGFGGNPWVDELPPTIAKRLGGTLDEVIVSLGDLAPTFEEAKIFS